MNLCQRVCVVQPSARNGSSARGGPPPPLAAHFVGGRPVCRVGNADHRLPNANKTQVEALLTFVRAHQTGHLFLVLSNMDQLMIVMDGAKIYARSAQNLATSGFILVNLVG
jgi:hypothetical protein